MADQHNPRCTSLGNYPTRVRTPNLERLADSGARFERAFAQSPSCTPSRTSFVTGQYPLNHGCYDNGGEAPDFLSTKRRYWTCPYVDGPADGDAGPTSNQRFAPSDDRESRPN